MPAPPPPVVARLGVRAAARLLDAVILVAALTPISLVGDLLGLNDGPHYDLSSNQFVEGGNPLLRLTFRAVMVVAVIGYEPVLIATRGATLGKRALRLAVLRRSDGSLPGWGPAVVRTLLPLLGVLACFVGQFVVYLSPLLDRSGYNRGWHDKVAGTVVIRD